MKVSILAFPGVDELDLFGVYSILDKANAINKKKWLLEIVSITGNILTSKGCKISTCKMLKPFPSCDILVLPGGSAAKKESLTGKYNDFINYQLSVRA